MMWRIILLMLCIGFGIGAIHAQHIRFKNCTVGDVETECVTKFIELDETKKKELLTPIQQKTPVKNLLESALIIEINISKNNTNKIDCIPNGLLAAHPNLISLKYISSKVRRLCAGIFPPIKLEILLLRANEIETIDDFALQNLTSLKKLDLSRNRLVAISRNAFTASFALRTLKLEQNKIHTIENGAFEDLKELLVLHLNGNQLKSLNDETFNGLQNLKKLYIGSNQIEKIQNSLYSLDNVEMILAQSNPIDDVDLIKFAQLPELVSLDLSNTSTTGLNLDSYNINSDFLSNLKLKELHLDSNNITIAGSLKVLQIFPKLTWLSLKTNNMKIIDDFALQKLTTLTKLDLSKNRIATINRNTLVEPSAPRAEKLDGTNVHFIRKWLLLEANEIETIEDFALQNLTALTDLDLSKNRLATIRRNTFTGLFALRELKLSENEIDSIENGAFNDLKELLVLLFNGNQLKSLNGETFAGLQKIQQLDIGSNQIETIGNLLYSMISLKMIRAQSNPINDIDLVKFAGLPELLSLDLSNTSNTGLKLDSYNISSSFSTDSKLIELHFNSNNIRNASHLMVLRIFPKIMWIHLLDNGLRVPDVMSIFRKLKEPKDFRMVRLIM